MGYSMVQVHMMWAFSALKGKQLLDWLSVLVKFQINPKFNVRSNYLQVS